MCNDRLPAILGHRYVPLTPSDPFIADLPPAGNGIANPAPLTSGGQVTLNINSIFTGFIAAATDGNSVYGGASLIYVNLNVSLRVLVMCMELMFSRSLETTGSYVCTCWRWSLPDSLNSPANEDSVLD